MGLGEVVREKKKQTKKQSSIRWCRNQILCSLEINVLNELEAKSNKLYFFLLTFLSKEESL